MPDAISATWFIFLTFFGATEYAQQARFIDRAQELRVGMTPEDLLDVMGPPTGRYEARSLSALLFMKFQPEHWLYGESIDIHSLAVAGLPFPNPIPIHIRIFRYADNDVVVRWSFDDRVVEITRPEPIDVPKEFYEILDAASFVFETVERFTAMEERASN